MPKISEKLQHWVIEALDLGFDCFCEGDHVPFALILDSEGKQHLVDFPSASGAISPELLDTARKTIAEAFSSAQLYALVWDGYLTIDDEKQDAVFAEVGERGKVKAFIFAQIYKQKKRSGNLQKVDEPVVVTTTQHLWK